MLVPSPHTLLPPPSPPPLNLLQIPLEPILPSLPVDKLIVPTPLTIKIPAPSAFNVNLPFFVESPANSIPPDDVLFVLLVEFK